MITQYSNAGMPPSNFVNLVANKANLLDKVIVMQTGQYQYQGLVFNPVTKNGTIYTITRNTSGSNTYTLTEQDTNDNSYTVLNEYYVYSNQSIGIPVDIPAYEGVQAYSCAFLTVTLSLAILFKGVLFKCLRKGRNSYF